MKALAGLAVLALSAPPAWAAAAEQACRAFSRQDLAVVMREKPGPDARFGTGQPGVFGDFAAVVAQCSAAVAQAPDDPDLRLQYARALIANNDLKPAAEVLKPLVQADQPTALRLYGILLLYGQGAQGGAPEADRLLRKASDLGDPVAPLFVGFTMITDRQPEDAYRPWILRAIETGFAPAEYIASAEIAGGKLTGFTQADRLRLLQDAAAKGWPPAMSSLAELLRQGKRLPSDPKRAEELEKAVKAVQPGIDSDFVVYHREFG